MPTYSANLKSNGYTKLYLEITPGAGNVAGNYTPVTYRLYMQGQGGEWDNEGSWGDLTINGVKENFTLASYDFRPSGTTKTYTLISTKTVNVPHDADGKKVLSYRAYYNPNNPGYMVSATIEGTLTLATIPRASKFTASNVNAGAPQIPITLTKSPASTTHRVKIMFGSTQITEKDIGASPTFIPITTTEWDIFYNLTKTVTSGSWSITLTTFNGTSNLGIDTRTITVTYATSDIPSFTTITGAETNTAVSNVITSYLQLLSKIRLTINSPVGIKGSTIKAYEIKVDTATYSTNNPIYTPTKPGDLIVSARVQDSRNRWSSTKTLTINVLAYNRPSLSGYTLDRATSAGVVDILGTYARAKFNASVASVIVGTQKNNIRYKIDDITNLPTRVNKVGTQTVLNTSASNLTHTFGTYSIDSVAVIQIVVTDAFNESVSYNLTLSSARVPFSRGTNGVAVGGVFTENGETLQVYGKSVFYDDIRVYGGRTYVDGYDNTTYPLGVYDFTSGVLIDTGLVTMTTSHMCFLRIYGNSFGNIDPINTLLQFYWYWNSIAGTYSFQNCAQRNFGYELGQIKLMVMNGKVHIWIPPLASASYITLKLELYTWSGQTVPCTATNSAEPTTGVYYKTGATIARDDGDIIEKGSNANGAYIKFADGTMICRHVLTSGVGNTTSGNVFLGTLPNWTYPATFIEAPQLSGMPRYIIANGPSCLGVTRITGVPPNGLFAQTLYVVYSATSTTVQYLVDIVAIGRWK